MNWLQITRDSAPLFKDSGVEHTSDAGLSQRQSFFNNVQEVFDTTPLRFCLPHQVRPQ